MYTRQRTHMLMPLILGDHPPPAAIEAQRIDTGPLSEPLGDDELSATDLFYPDDAEWEMGDVNEKPKICVHDCASTPRGR